MLDQTEMDLDPLCCTAIAYWHTQHTIRIIVLRGCARHITSHISHTSPINISVRSVPHHRRLHQRASSVPE